MSILYVLRYPVKRFAFHLSVCYCNIAAFRDIEQCCAYKIQNKEASSAIHLCWFSYLVLKNGHTGQCQNKTVLGVVSPFCRRVILLRGCS